MPVAQKILLLSSLYLLSSPRCLLCVSSVSLFFIQAVTGRSDSASTPPRLTLPNTSHLHHSLNPSFFSSQRRVCPVHQFPTCQTGFREAWGLSQPVSQSEARMTPAELSECPPACRGWQDTQCDSSRMQDALSVNEPPASFWKFLALSFSDSVFRIHFANAHKLLPFFQTLVHNVVVITLWLYVWFIRKNYAFIRCVIRSIYWLL